jgi:sterol desaturase/sphingolipid hydroxylase (fatty acid hydroxylase superfamily)
VVFTYDHMQMRSSREFRLVLVPAYAVVLIALIDAPLAFVLWKLVTPNTGLIYLATAMFFFLSYEWLHLSYHLPETSFIGRLPLIAKLREHHRRHHDPRLMKTWNFNVTVPVFDWIYGSNWSPERERARAGRRARRSAAAPSESPS